MSKNKHKVIPTIQEEADFLSFLCGEDVKFPYFKYPYKVELPNQSYLDKRFNN